MGDAQQAVVPAPAVYEVPSGPQRRGLNRLFNGKRKVVLRQLLEVIPLSVYASTKLPEIMHTYVQDRWRLIHDLVLQINHPKLGPRHV